MSFEINDNEMAAWLSSAQGGAQEWEFLKDLFFEQAKKTWVIFEANFPKYSAQLFVWAWGMGFSSKMIDSGFTPEFDGKKVEMKKAFALVKGTPLKPGEKDVQKTFPRMFRLAAPYGLAAILRFVAWTATGDAIIDDHLKHSYSNRKLTGVPRIVAPFTGPATDILVSSKTGWNEFVRICKADKTVTTENEVAMLKACLYAGVLINLLAGGYSNAIATVRAGKILNRMEPVALDLAFSENLIVVPDAPKGAGLGALNALFEQKKVPGREKLKNMLV